MAGKVGNPNIVELGRKTRFPNGYSPVSRRKTGSENLKKKLAKEIYADILLVDKDKGTTLTYKQMIMELKQLMFKHSMVAKHVLEGYFGKPIEKIQQDIQTIHIISDAGKSDANTITVDTNMDALPTNTCTGDTNTVSGTYTDNTNTCNGNDTHNGNSNAQSTHDDE